MAAETTAQAAPWSTPSAAEIAEAAGASDLFVFRRVAESRFAHVGGVGFGAGWAGIVEIGMDNEPLVRQALSTSSLTRRSQPEPWHVLGPYYGRSVALVSVSSDLFVVFGAQDERMDTVADEDLLSLARFAAEALVDVAPAKRLADELEVLNAVRDLLQAHADTYAEGLQRLVNHATVSLSCDLGLLYVPEQDRLVVCDRRAGATVSRRALDNVLTHVTTLKTFPTCIQRAEEEDLPPPLSAADGVLAYYLLEISGPLPGMLLLLHTVAGTARGFTLLCQSLGARLVEAAEPLLAAALLRDGLNTELERAAEEARRDALTGLANRLAWDEALSAVETESPASIVLVDCRGLKAINDTYGHGQGDEVLCRVAAALTAAVRSEDLVARLGGDEFGILLRSADEAMAQTVVDRIEAGLSEKGDADKPEVRLAIGASTAHDGDLGAARERADVQMLAAKRASR